MLKRFLVAICATWVAVAGAQTLTQVTGTITTQNLVSAGDCTAGSCVEIDVTGIASVTVQTKGTYTGALSAQVTVDRKTWVTECSSSCTNTFTRRTTGVQSATITSGQQDVYQVQFANGAKRLRITALAAVTGTVTITIQPSNVGAGSDSDTSRLTSSAGPNTAGAALSTTAFQVGGRYLTTPATMTNGQEAGITLTEDQQVRTSDAAVLAAINDPMAQMPATLGGKAPADSFATFNASATGAVSSVADTATDTTCLAADATTKGVTVYNTSSAALYLLLANATSSATNFTVRLVQNAYYEVPFSYTGVIKCIWASDPGDGAALVTKITN